METKDSQVSHVGANDVDLAPGREVGEYVVDGKVGEGGFGTVFRATHPLIGKQVAIKVLSRQYSANAEMVSRFQAEARAVNQIRHRNIIDIFSFGQLEDGRHYYVMEFLDGQPLDGYLEVTGAVPIEQALPILRDIARALDAAHAKDIVHRDLKPENVFLAHDPDGTVFPKLLDFGIAKLMTNQGQKHRTQTGAPIGTPAYMSPEQCRGRDVDHRTDVYAFGVLAYEVLTGGLPFDSEEYMEVILAHLQDQPEPPSSRLASLPAGIDGCILKMLSKDPAERPGCLSDAVGHLEEAARAAGLDVPTSASPTGVHSAARARTASAVGRASAGGLATAISSAETIDAEQLAGQLRESGVLDQPRPESKRAGGVVVAIGVAVVALGGGAWFALGGGADGGEAEPATAATAAAAPEPAPVPDKPEPTPEPTPEPETPAAVPPPAPAMVAVSIEGAPKGTEIYGPNGPVGVAPGPITLTQGSEAITLTFKADGYQMATRRVVPNEDQTLSVQLEAKRRRAADKAPRKSRKDRRSRKKRDTLEDPFAQ